MLANKVLLTTITLMAISTLTIAADKPKNRQEEQREAAQARAAQQQVKEAEEKLQDARRRLREAQTKASQSQSRQKTASQQVQQLRVALEKKHEEATGVAAARESQRAAKEEFAAASRPLLAALRENAEYQATVTAADAAKARLRTLADDKGITSEERASLAKTLSRQTLAPSQFERAAIDANPKASAAHEKLERANELVAAAVEKLEQAIARDPELKQAMQTLDKTRDEFEEARRHVAVEERKAEQTAELLAREEAQLKQLLARQRQDDARDRQRNNNDKNKNDNKNPKNDSKK